MKKEVTSNKTVYTEIETKWGKVIESDAKLFPHEMYLCKKYLDKDVKTIIEAGTGSGRIAFCVEKMGDYNIHAFDYVDKFIENANISKENMNSEVEFSVADATNLCNYKDEYYDFGIYLQQVLSFVPREQINQAVSEMAKKMKKGGHVICTVLNYSGRRYNKILSLLLQILRFFRGEKKTYKELPWLKNRGKINKRIFRKGEATVYWFDKKEVVELFRKNGFEVLECRTLGEIEKRKYESVLCLAVRKAY